MGNRRAGRIIAVHPHADMYGSDRVFLESVLAMGPQTRVVVAKRGPLVDALERHGVRYELQDFPVLRKVELRSVGAALAFLRAFLAAVVRLTRWLRAQGPDALYVSTIAAPEWIIAGRLSGARVVCHVHESEPHMSRAASAALLSPLLAAHAVVANSDDCRTWIVSSLGGRVRRRVQVLYNGVREPAVSAPTPQGTPGVARLVVVGRLAERKGQDLAIAAAAVVRQAGFDVRLTLVGDGYPGYEAYTAGLHDLAEATGMTDVVEFTGFTDPAPHVAAADVVLVPSRVEPFGLVAVEALLQARPVVAARVGGLTEIIRDGVTGLLVEPDDARSMAEAIISLLSDADTATALGEAGRADARERFSLEGYAARLAEAVLPAA